MTATATKPTDTTKGASQWPNQEFAITLSDFCDQMVDIWVPGNIPSFLWGPPGTGKSAAIKQTVINRLKMKFLAVYGTSLQETDFTGLPTFKVVDGNTLTVYTLPEIVNICQAEPTYLFFDEWNRSDSRVQNAALTIFSPERQMSFHKLPDHTRLGAAGNNCGTGIVNQSEAMEDRFAHCYLAQDHKGWLNWGANNGINMMVLAHIMHMPEDLYTIKRAQGEKGHASPRQWEAVSHVVDQVMLKMDPVTGRLPYSIQSQRSMVSGLIGEAKAKAFVSFLGIFDKVQPPTYFISNPDTAEIPKELSYKFIVCSALARMATPANWKAINKFTSRLDDEFKTMTMISATKLNPGLCATEEYIKHSIKISDLMS